MVYSAADLIFSEKCQGTLRGGWTADRKASWEMSAWLHVRPHSRFDCREVNISVQIENDEVLTTRKFNKILFENGAI